MSPISTLAEHAGRVHDLLGAALADLPVGLIGQVDAEGPDDRLRALLVALERVKNAADAVQAEVLVALGREALAADDLERGDSDMPIRSNEEFVPDEVSALLSCTRMAAAGRYSLAWQADRYRAVAEGWRNGVIDARKVAAIADQLQHVDDDVADRLSAPAVEYASHRTAAQAREWLRRKVLSIDPGAAEKRREAALLERKVVITPVADGMSELWARVPSIEGRRMQVALSQLAQSLGGDDPRTMDQRRADVLVDLVLGEATPPQIDLQLVVPVSPSGGPTNDPAWVPGMGPVTAQAAGALLEQIPVDLQQQASALLMVDAVTGSLIDRVEPRYRPSLGLDRVVRSRDMTCRFPGCRRSALGRASGTDLDHTVPWPQGPTSDTNLAVLCRHHHRLKHAAGWQVTLHSDGSMTWTTPTGRTLTTEAWQYLDPTEDRGVPPSEADPDPPPD